MWGSVQSTRNITDAELLGASASVLLAFALAAWVGCAIADLLAEEP